MKKFVSILTALVLVIGLVSGLAPSAFAEDGTYPLWIQGIQVTDSNKNDILGDGGSVRFDPEGETLTLNDPSFSTESIAGVSELIRIEDMYLTINGSGKIVGPESIKTAVRAVGQDKYKILYLNGDFEIKGSEYGVVSDYQLEFLDTTSEISGGLTAVAADAVRIGVNAGLSINGTNEYGVQAYSDIDINGGNMSIFGGKSAVWAGTGGISIDGSVELFEAEINTDNGSGYNYSSAVMTEGELSIGSVYPMKVEAPYGGKAAVAGLQDKTTGKFEENGKKYGQIVDADGNIAQYVRVKHDCPAKVGVLCCSNLDQAFLYSSNNGRPIELLKDIATPFVIDAESVMNVIKNGYELTVLPPDVDHIVKETEKEGGITEYRAVPADEEEPVEDGYKLWLGSTQVTDDNLNDILGDGCAKFDPSSETLTLNYPEQPFMPGEYQGAAVFAMDMHLTVKGKANIVGNLMVGISSVGDDCGLIIDGNINANGSQAGLYSTGDLVIEGGTVNAVGNDYGISAERVTVNGGKIRIVGHNHKGVHTTGDITINGGDLDIEGGLEGLSSYDGTITINDGVSTLSVKAQNIMIVGSGELVDLTEGEDRQAVIAGRGIVLGKNVTVEDPKDGMASAVKVSGVDTHLVNCLTEADGKTVAENAYITAEMKHVPGDINGDGKQPNTRDVIMLLKHITGERVKAVKGALDTNGDRKVNTRDVINLLRFITGEPVELY